MKGTCLWVLVLEGLVSLQELFNFSFLNITGWGIDLDCCDAEWFALEMNTGHSVVFEVTSKYCISDSFFFFFNMRATPILLRDSCLH